MLAPTWDQFPWIDYLSAAREDLSDLASNELWLAKDPRLCLTYPAYVHVLLRRVPLLAAIRALSVAGSLFARNGLPVNAGLCLWFLYNHHLSFALAADEPLIAYTQLLQSGGNDVLSAEVHRRICTWLEQAGIQSGDFRTWSNALAQKLRPSLDRANDLLTPSVLSGVSPLLLETCELAYTTCLQQGADGSAAQQAFGSLPRVILDTQQRIGICPSSDHKELARLREVVDISRHESQQLESRLQDVQAELLAIKDSKSWRVTAPLRRLMRQFRI